MLQHSAHKWEKIALSLGFTRDEIANIKATPTLLHSGPTSYLDAMFAEWEQWAPDDARGSTDYATLNGLITAVREAGMGRTAQELSQIVAKPPRASCAEQSEPFIDVDYPLKEFFLCSSFTIPARLGWQPCPQ